MSSPAPTSPRPRALTIAFWLLIVGAVLLMLGGLFATTITFETVRHVAPSSVSDDQVRGYLTLHRVSGVICMVAGAGLAYLTGKLRKGDARFRRAALALAAVIIVLVVLIALFAVVNIVSVLALIPTIAGAVLLTRPAVSAWFAGAPG